MFDPHQVHTLAAQNGFKKIRPKNWARRTIDFIQLVNLQGSQWSQEENYLNFALWCLAFGEPSSMVEYKFHFRMRAEELGVSDAFAFFAAIEGKFENLNQLGSTNAAHMHIDLRRMLSL
jgi:hypothetical protein